MQLKEYTEELDALVVAQCRDYDRRGELIRLGRCERRTLMELRYINYRIYEAAAETVGELLAEIFIKEIGGRTGYAESAVDCMNEKLYKQNKQLCKLAIARRLHLMD